MPSQKRTECVCYVTFIKDSFYVLLSYSSVNVDFFWLDDNKKLKFCDRKRPSATAVYNCKAWEGQSVLFTTELRKSQANV